MSDIKIVIETDSSVDLRDRFSEIMDDLGYPSYSSAARAAGIDPAHMRRITLSGEPNMRTLKQIAKGWGVPLLAFFLSRSAAAPLVSSAPRYIRRRNRKNPTQKINL
jgi:hypothetical protein